MSELRLIQVQCNDCKTLFFPYGRSPIVPPLVDRLKCPKCGVDNQVVLDSDLQRELARKKMGLSSLEEGRVFSRLDRIESDSLELKRRLETLETEISQFREKLMVEIEEKIETVYAKLLTESQKAKQPAMKVV